MRIMTRSVSCIAFLVLLGAGPLLNRLPIAEAVAAEPPKYGGTFVVGLSGEPPMMTIWATAAFLCQLPYANVHGALVQVDKDGNYVGDLAESWEISPDFKTYTYRLVKNALWHDGKPFTSADVKFSIEEILYKIHPRGKLIFAGLDRVDTPDPYTAIVRFKEPNIVLECYVGPVHQAIIPKHIYEGTDPLKNPQNSNPIGTGPFKFKEYVRGSHITLVRNDKYYRKGMPYLDRLVFKIVPDEAMRAAALEKGEVDHWPYYGFPLADLARLSKLPHLVVAENFAPHQAIMHIRVNGRNPPLSNVKVRQALAYAIDRREIVEKVLYGTGGVAYGPIPTKTKWAYNPKLQQMQPFDPAMAEKLLDEAGYPRREGGVRLKVTYTYDKGLFEHSKTAEIIRLHLQKVGVDLVLQGVDKQTNDALNAEWKYELMTIRSNAGPDPSLPLNGFWSQNIRHIYGGNTDGYNNSRFDLLFEQGNSEVNRQKRTAIYQEAQEILVKDQASIWLFEVGYPILTNAKFKGIPPGGYGLEPYDSIWWTGGSELSPEAISSVIKDTEKQLESLRGQFYDVNEALKQLEQAKKSLEAGDYLKAAELARGAAKLAQPPYAMYGGATLAVIVVAVAGFIWYRRRRKPTG